MTTPEVDSASNNMNDDSATTNGEISPNVHISSHPVIAHKISILRSSITTAGTFRAVLRELTYHLGYEATKTLSTQPIKISVPIPNSDEHMDFEGSKLAERVAIIPILRSGQGMIEAMLELVPNASVHHIGMYKVAGSDPVQYYNRLPRKCRSDVAYVLDPVIATSSTVMSVVGILKKWGVPVIHVLSVVGSRSGLKQIAEKHPDIMITVGTVDEIVTDDGVLLPGIGDCGDRMFGTFVFDEEDDEALMHPSRRKRALSKTLE